MQDIQLITHQARRIAELEERVRLYEESERKIYLQLYGVGGPLNDNKLRYTKEQMLPFARIASQLNLG